MIIGVKKEATNSTNDVGTGVTVYNILTIPTGKVFVLTELEITASYANDTAIAEASNDLFKLYDFIGSGSTAASGNGTALVSVNMPLYPVHSWDKTAASFVRGSTILKYANGPEFSTGVTPGMGAGNAAIVGTGCVRVAGVLR
jgi:hypothetical protein